jgi:hypothetical protein
MLVFVGGTFPLYGCGRELLVNRVCCMLVTVGGGLY